MGVAAIAHFDLPGSTGTFDITSTDLGGLIPKLAVFIVARVSSATGAAGGNATWGMGATDGTRQWAGAVVSQSGATETNVKRLWSKTDTIITLTGSGGTDGLAAYSSFITNGVRLNCTNAWAFGHGVALLIAGDDVSVYCGTGVCPNSGSSTNVTAPGFEPDWGIFGCLGTAATTAEDFFHWAFGMAENTGAGVNQHCIAMGEDNAVLAGGEPRGRVTSSRVTGQTTTGASTWAHSQDITSWDSTGFTIHGNDGNPSGDEYGYVVVKGGFEFSVDIAQLPTTTGNQSLVDPGFTPDVRWMYFSSMDALDTSESVDAGGVGSLAMSASEQGSFDIEIENGADPTNTSTRHNNSGAGGTYDIDVSNSAGTTTIEADYVDMDTLNFTTAGDNGYYITLSLLGLSQTPIIEQGQLTPDVLRGPGAGGFEKPPLLKTMQGFNSL